MKRKIGIRREDKSEWERRAPLAPEHVRLLRDRHGIETVVQPSRIRVFTDQEYRDAGATVDEDLSQCDLVVAVKEIPTELFREQGAYMFFSHTVKGQPHNMPMLRTILDLGCTLLDHEKVADDQGRRLIFFGRHAGLAGMIDTLWALGQRLAAEGHATPLAGVRPAYQYPSLADALKHLRKLRRALQSNPLPREIGPVVFGLTGYGNVSRGAQEVLDVLVPTQVEPADLDLLEDGRIYKVVFREEHTVEPIDEGASFDLKEYYEHPERYRGIFERFLDRLTVLVNCIYWEERYPRVVTDEGLKRLFSAPGTPRLRVIGDLSCDICGGCQATVKATQPDNPVYVVDPVAGKVHDGFEGRGPVVLAVDNLPCELPREATVDFGAALAGMLPDAVKADFSAPYDKLEMPAPLKRSVIALQGELTPPYSYLEKHLGGSRGGKRRDR